MQCNPPLFLDLESGLQVLVKNQIDFFLFHEIFGTQEYEPMMSEISWWSTTHPSRPLRLIDLGSNIGYFTLYVADKLSRRGIDFDIQAVEGSSTNLSEFADRLRGQTVPVLVDRVSFMSGLVGKRTGHGNLQEYIFHTMNCIVPDNRKPYNEVAYLDLDQALTPGPIDLIKCDIEGSELEFLQNYPDLLKRTQYFLFELHTEMCPAEACWGELRKAGMTRIASKTRGDVFIELWGRR